MGVVHLSDDPYIDLIRDLDGGDAVDEDDDPDEANFVHPLLSMSPRIVELFEKMDKMI